MVNEPTDFVEDTAASAASAFGPASKIGLLTRHPAKNQNSGQYESLVHMLR